MTQPSTLRNSAICIVALACCALAESGQVGIGRANEEGSTSAVMATAIPPRQDGAAVVIDNDSQLPDTPSNVPYEVRFRARGGAGAQHWQLKNGALPPGMKLEDDGLLHGKAERTGEFEFTLAVTDSRRSEASVQKGFVLRVRSALTVDWKTAARVTGNRIDGSVEVVNYTQDTIDLTFYVLAVADDNGRATAIGYQRVQLRHGATMELPFGETLPHGGYVVHADVVGEVAAKKLIYREHMQTASALQVTVGP